MSLRMVDGLALLGLGHLLFACTAVWVATFPVTVSV
jgi:hypothetical protein